MINVIVVQGNLVADPEFFGDGGSVAKFTIANNTGFGDNRETHYVDCVAFGKQVDTIKNHFVKGKQIVVRGSLRQNRWTNADGENRSKLELRLDNYGGFSFVSGGQSSAQGDDAAPVTSGAGEPEKLF